VDFSLAFNTIIPDLLQPKLTQLSVPTSICQWITSFLTPADNNTLIGLIQDGDESAYRQEVKELAAVLTTWS